MEHLSRFRESASRELGAVENALKEILARRTYGPLPYTRTLTMLMPYP